MMQTMSIVGLLCDDIREEKSGQDTLVGVMPDNLSVPAVPGALTKLHIYMRLNFDPEADLGVITTRLITPGQDDIPLGVIDEGVVKKARNEARGQSKPIAGVIAKTVVAPFPIIATGLMKGVAT